MVVCGYVIHSTGRRQRGLVSVTISALYLQPTNRGIVMANELIKHVSDASFEADVLQSKHPVLVDYWAEWCGPCKMIAPMLDEVAQTYAGRLKVAKVNIDQHQKTPRNYNVRGIPTLMIFKNGKVEATQIGAMNRTQLTQLIDRTI